MIDWDDLRDVIRDGTIEGDPRRERLLDAAFELQAVVRWARPFGAGGFGPDARRHGLRLRLALERLDAVMST